MTLMSVPSDLSARGQVPRKHLTATPHGQVRSDTPYMPPDLHKHLTADLHGQVRSDHIGHLTALTAA